VAINRATYLAGYADGRPLILSSAPLCSQGLSRLRRNSIVDLAWIFDVALKGRGFKPRRKSSRISRGLRAKVNLIALNPGPDIPFSTPAEGRVHQFQKILVESGIPAYIRRPRGLDIYAACGQLKRTVA